MTVENPLIFPKTEIIFLNKFQIPHAVRPSALFAISPAFTPDLFNQSVKYMDNPVDILLMVASGSFVSNADQIYDAHTHSILSHRSLIAVSFSVSSFRSSHGFLSSLLI
jgi:hypothetical protein